MRASFIHSLRNQHIVPVGKLIFHNRLNGKFYEAEMVRMKWYCIQLLQKLKLEHFAKRYEFCNSMQATMEENDGFENLLVFSDEATFHLSGKVNCHNVHICDTEKPWLTVQHERDSPKVNGLLHVDGQNAAGHLDADCNVANAKETTAEECVVGLRTVQGILLVKEGGFVWCHAYSNQWLRNPIIDIKDDNKNCDLITAAATWRGLIYPEFQTKCSKIYQQLKIQHCKPPTPNGSGEAMLQDLETEDERRKSHYGTPVLARDHTEDQKQDGPTSSENM
ncbi:hypothetical protein ANN_21270 [Periplaneta americana]|uniref:Uncharacterized protein n=1 Tax=Periplaneta americana TaxID=6978 RepID=A0ABQ8SG26_PERAM|nr:hypothetical protein ANN_21270 [Periplaneta americana]